MDAKVQTKFQPRKQFPINFLRAIQKDEKIKAAEIVREMAEGEKRKIPSWFPTPFLSSPPPPPPPPPPPETAAAGEVVEEEKVETFFKLIGNMIAERELWHSSFFCRRKRQRRDRELWKPTFQWEDFAGESHGRSSVVEAGRIISRKEMDEKGEEEISVDLNLGL